MEYKQTKMALVAQALTKWWWLGVLTCGISIIINILRWTRAKLIVGDRAISIEDGIMTVKTQDMPYDKINSVTVVQSALGQIFGYGHLQISSGNDSRPIIFKYLDNPTEVRQVIQDMINKQ